MGDAFAPWHIIILVVVLVLLFGARRLPGAAQSLGQSMHIFKKSVAGLNPEDGPSASYPGASQSALTSAPAPTAPAQAPEDATAQQLLDLQRQVAELQRQTAGSSNGEAAQAQSPQSL